MVGGIVVNVYDTDDGLRTVECRSTRYKNRACVKVKRDYDVEFGDGFWWQGKWAYWTKPGGDEQKIPRESNSFAPAQGE